MVLVFNIWSSVLPDGPLQSDDLYQYLNPTDLIYSG